MSLSIGSSGSNMGPRGAIRDFGKQKEGKAFDLRIIMRLLAYLRPYWLRMSLAITFVLVSAALTLSVPYLIKVAIDQYIANGDDTAAVLVEADYCVAQELRSLFVS